MSFTMLRHLVQAESRAAELVHLIAADDRSPAHEPIGDAEFEERFLTI